MPCIWDRYYITESKYFTKADFRILKALVEHGDVHLKQVSESLGISQTRIKQARLKFLSVLYHTIEHRVIVNGKRVSISSSQFNED